MSGSKAEPSSGFKLHKLHSIIYIMYPNSLLLSYWDTDDALQGLASQLT